MHLACSSALCGGGTNQELALHCLYECKGDIMVSLVWRVVALCTYRTGLQLVGALFKLGKNFRASEVGIAMWKTFE